ncbi:MAG: class I SAM-dependent methyltransferase [Myxococcota bacterium]
MTIECISCGAQRSEVVLRAEGITLRKCSSCGLTYLESWRTSLAQATELYEYFDARSNVPLEQRFRPENATRQRELLARLGRYVRGRSLMDVGCGEGQFIHTALAAGWTARGIDLADGAVRQCQNYGLPVEKTDFFSSELNGDRFDLILMSELLEHVPDPGSFLQRAEELLAPSGILYLTTPNFGSLSRRLLQGDWRAIHPQHVSYLTEGSLRRLIAARTGLVPRELGSVNVSPGTLKLALRQRTRRRDPGRHPRAEVNGPVGHVEQAWSLDQQLRRVLQRNRALRLAKEGVNLVVSKARVGDTLVAVLQRPA